MALTKVDDRGLKTPIDLLDNEKIRLGTGTDSALYHDGTDTHLDNDTGELALRSDTIRLRGRTGNETLAVFEEDGASKLYYDNSKKLETTSTGAKISGTGASFLEINSTDGTVNPMVRMTNGDRTWDAGLRGDTSDSYVIRDHTASASRLIIDSNGDVGIGTTNPTTPLHVKGVSGTLNVDSDPQLVLETSATDGAANKGTGILFLNHDGSGGSFGGSIQSLKENGTSGNTAHFMRFSTRHHNGAVTERMRIDSSGNVGIGTTSPIDLLQLSNATAQKKLVLSKANSGTADEHGMWLRFENYGPASTGRADGTIIGKIHFYASQPTSGSLQDAGAIECRADGSQTGNNTRSRLSFLTVDSQTATERMRIDKDGNVGIGTTGPQSPLHVYHATENSAATFESGDEYVHISFRDSTTSSVPYIGAQGDHLRLITGSTERMRVLPDGDAFLGGAAGADVTSNSNSKGFIYDNDTSSSGQAGGNHPFIAVQHATKTSGAAAYIVFQSQGSARGSVVESNLGNNVTYNTSSDYRLKQDEVIISDGITRLKQLKPYQFKWKDDLDYGYVDGFFAHEVGEVVKGAATGTKDEVVTQSGIDDGTYKGAVKVGDPVMQGLDYSRITPLLTAALKEAIAKIETLETKVAALEAA